jgi:TIR domain
MNGGKGFPGEAGSSIRKDKKDLFLSFPLIREPVNGTQVGSLEDFCSYSHKDKKWLERLQTMLKPLVRNSTISVWDDTIIPVGGKWKEQIEGALAAAKAAVLLVSSNFLGSDFIAEHELPPLLEAAEKQGLVILWVYVSSCLYDETEIKNYQAAHDIAKPLNSLKLAERDALLAEMCPKIKAASESVYFLSGGYGQKPLPIG